MSLADEAAFDLSLEIRQLFKDYEQREKIAEIAYSCFDKAERKARSVESELHDKWRQMVRLFGWDNLEEHFTENEIMAIRKALNL